MISELSNCPNCGQALRKGIMQHEISTQHTAFINKALGTIADAHCTKCTQSFYDRAVAENAKRRAQLVRELEPFLESVPIASIHNPPTWNFEVVGIVTAQSVAGTGLFADVGSSITDMFGMQSGVFKDKIRGGEGICKKELRLKALTSGADAIVGVDIDYAEVGGARCMMMVCMTGTAVRFSNLESLTEEAKSQMLRLRDIGDQIAHLS